MPFTPAELDTIHRTVGALVQRRQPPPHLLDKVRLELEIDGLRVRIWTVRPRFDDPTKTVREAVAQFTCNRTTNRWTLYWMRANRRWYAWPPAGDVSALPELVRIVDEDVEGAFWG